MNEQEQVPDYNDAAPNTNNVCTLRLFVTGASPNSIRAIANLTEICETYLNGNYELEIIDVHQQPLVAQSEQIIALPLLIVKKPLSPARRLIGDMSDTEKVLRGLGLHAAN